MDESLKSDEFTNRNGSTEAVDGEKIMQKSKLSKKDAVDQNNQVKIKHVQFHDVVAMKNILQDLSVMSTKFMSIAKETKDFSSSETVHQSLRLADVAISDKMVCSCCNVTFSSRTEQKEHYKLDWHRYNLKLKASGTAAVSEDIFCNLADDISSISGSEEDSDLDVDPNMTSKKWRPKGLPAHLAFDDTFHCSSQSSTDTEDETETAEGIHKTPKIVFRNGEGTILSLYKCILYGKQNVPSHDGELVRALCNLQNPISVAIILVGGGHFAASIFRGENAVVHKTFHRYTVRAKQGSAQGLRDAKHNGVPMRSAGASLRRHNEAALMQDIQNLLYNWHEDLKKCDVIYYRAPSFNKIVLFGGKNPPLKKGDARLRNIPFPTRRATFEEVRRIHKMLTTIECFENEKMFLDFLPKSPHKSRSRKSPYKTNGKSKISKNKKENVQESPRRGALKQESPQEDSQSADTSDSDTWSMVEEVMTINTQDLQPFAVTRKPRRRIKIRRRSHSSPRRQQDPDLDCVKEERYQIRNALYTVCKTGDVNELSNLITHILEDNRLNTESEKIEKILGNSQNDNIPPLSKECTESSEKKLFEPSFSKNTATHEDSTETQEISQDKIQCAKEIQDIPFLNEPYGDSDSTLLHISSRNGQVKIIRILLEHGADPSLTDKLKQTPYAVAADRETRNEFRQFMADYPNRYNYQKSQIPSPLDKEKEVERALKQAEKRKAQRKAKKEAQKEKRAEDMKMKAEQEERKHFLSLSDREKMALAAERRILLQAEQKNEPKPVLNRCYQCGCDISGKIPFHYNNFQFCTPKCVQSHRKKVSPTNNFHAK